MASSSAAQRSKAQQYRFAESSPKTLVGLHKTDAQLKKMIDSLDHEQNTAVNSIANHQQAMKMSWRRLEERRSSSPLMTRAEKNEQAKSSKRGMMLQSNTRLYVDKTPEIYHAGTTAAGSSRPTTVDDSLVGRSRVKGHILYKPPRVGPPPTQLTRAHTSPYISSPLNFRKKIISDKAPQQQDADNEGQSGSDTKLSDSQDLNSTSSQPVLIKSSAMNSKETLLRASTLMDMKTTSTGSAGFKGFYAERPRSQVQSRKPAPSVVGQQIEDVLTSIENEQGEDEEPTSNSMPSLAEQFEQIKNCKYIRHSRTYNPELAERDDY